MINRLYNLPESIISNIYSYDTTFRYKYNICMNEMMKLMDSPPYPDYCCYYCDGPYPKQKEGDRMNEYFIPFNNLKRIKIKIKRIKQEIIDEQNCKLTDDGFTTVFTKKEIKTKIKQKHKSIAFLYEHDK